MNLVQRFLTRNDCYVNNVKKADYRYTLFQQRGPLGLMLHSVGCPQPNASVFLDGWDKPGVDKMVHAFIDANSGTVYQAQPWNFRGWHCAGSGNNTHIGVEMCESSHIRYLKVGEAGYYPGKFVILDKAKALADCTRTYHAAVELYAMLCTLYKLDPLLDICSHKEGWYKGIASNHGDPEHYWTGLGTSYTMDGFRRDVKKKMEDEVDMTKEEVTEIIDKRFVEAAAKLSDQFDATIERALTRMTETAESVCTSRVGKEIEHLKDIPSKAVQDEFWPLLEDEYINGGTPRDKDATDIRLPWSTVRAITVLKRYVDATLRAFLEDVPDPDACGETCEIVFPDEEAPGAGEE